ncbi:MAG TPA: membrane dipeptidase [Polyangiaceae bacterium]|nr:membrane dipeptidase [Polyangiaceae bacterium]
MKPSADWARELGVPLAAIELYRASDVIDLHVDSFIWQRTLGYDLTKRHRAPLWGAFLGQVDFPRIVEAEISGATWVITTNPVREPADRAQAFERNLADLCGTFERVPSQFQIVRNAREYATARAAGKHAAFLGIQGGNALDFSLDEMARLCDGRVLRITLVHLSSSRIGSTSSPMRLADTGLSAFGSQMVELLNERKVLVDLAHISARGFWAACDAHAKDTPFVVTHTGVSGVYRHWRNLDDNQIRAVARSGGVVGIMYHAPFLGDRPWAGRVETIARHLAHVLEIGGEETPALGSDWDGSIITPRDMPTCLELPRLVAALSKRGIADRVIQKILGTNFLRVVRELRG